MKSSSNFITGLLAGATIGGVIALLYAPKTGKETREQMRHKFDELEKERLFLKEKLIETKLNYNLKLIKEVFSVSNLIISLVK